MKRKTLTARERAAAAIKEWATCPSCKPPKWDAVWTAHLRTSIASHIRAAVRAALRKRERQIKALEIEQVNHIEIIERNAEARIDAARAHDSAAKTTGDAMKTAVELAKDFGVGCWENLATSIEARDTEWRARIEAAEKERDEARVGRDAWIEAERVAAVTAYQECAAHLSRIIPYTGEARSQLRELAAVFQTWAATYVGKR